MWFMNKITNPFVRFILRSPLHGLLSASLMLISYHGRKSGQEYTLPVQYAQDGHIVTLVVGMAEQKNWWRNLRGGASVQLILTGKRVSGQAEVLEGAAHISRIVRALTVYLQKFPVVSKQHHIEMDADGSLNQDDLRKEAAATVVVQLELEQPA